MDCRRNFSLRSLVAEGGIVVTQCIEHAFLSVFIAMNEHLTQ